MPPFVYNGIHRSDTYIFTIVHRRAPAPVATAFPFPHLRPIAIACFLVVAMQWLAFAVAQAFDGVHLQCVQGTHMRWDPILI